MGLLNGKPKNGHAPEDTALPALYDHAREPAAVWPPADDAWPKAEPDEFELERQQLEAEIAAAKARAAAARHRGAVSDAQMRAALKTELDVSREHLAALEAEHGSTLATVREAAQAEAATILAEARQQVAGGAVPAPSAEPTQVTSVE